MSIIDSPEFNAWLDAEFGIDREAEPGSIGCTECGSSPELYPFIGAYCVLCLAVRYGEFLKAQDIALWLSDHAWIWQPGNINDKARLSARSVLSAAGSTPTRKMRSSGHGGGPKTRAAPPNRHMGGPFRSLGG